MLRSSLHCLAAFIFLQQFPLLALAQGFGINSPSSAPASKGTNGNTDELDNLEAVRQLKAQALVVQKVISLSGLPSSNAPDEHTHRGSMKSEDLTDSPHVIGKKKNIARRSFFLAAIALSLIGGYGLFHITDKLDSVHDLKMWVAKYSHMGLASCSAVLHPLAQFLPLWASHVPFFSQHDVSCEAGLPWEWHLTYTIILVCALPLLTCRLLARSDGSVPVFGCVGLCFDVYVYCTTVFLGYDQYSDSAGVALAYSCGWNKAWMMLSTLLVSWFLQCAAAAYFGGYDGLFLSVLSVNTEVAKRFGTGILNKTRFTSIESEREAARVHAILQIVKLLTEVIPQAGFSVLFAYEVKPNKIIWVSIGLSLAMATKAFFDGITYFCKESVYTPVQEESLDAPEAPLTPQEPTAGSFMGFCCRRGFSCSRL